MHVRDRAGTHMQVAEYEKGRRRRRRFRRTRRRRIRRYRRRPIHRRHRRRRHRHRRRVLSSSAPSQSLDIVVAVAAVVIIHRHQCRHRHCHNHHSHAVGSLSRGSPGRRLVRPMPPKKRSRLSRTEPIRLSQGLRPIFAQGSPVVDLTRSGDICGTCYSVPLSTAKVCSTCGSDFSMWQSPFAAMVCPVCYGVAGTHQCVFCNGDLCGVMWERFLGPDYCRGPPGC